MLDRYLVEFALMVVLEVVKRLLQVVRVEAYLHRRRWYPVVLTLLHLLTIPDHIEGSN